MFERVFLDTQYRRLLESIARSEELISDDNLVLGGNGHILDYSWSNDEQIVLDTIMLFKTVDSTISAYKWDKLIDLGVCSKSPKVHRYKYSEDIHYHPQLRNEILYNAARKSASRILLSNSTVITKQLLERDIEAQSIIGDHILLAESLMLFEKMFVETINEVSSQNGEGEAIEVRKKYTVENLLGKILVIDRFIMGVESLFYSYLEGVYYSSTENFVFSSHIVPLPSLNSLQSDGKIIEDSIYTVRHKFGSEVVLPTPRTIEEAVEFKNKKSIKRLREVIEEWSKAIKSGRVDIQNTIRREIDLCNRDLLKQKEISQFRKSNYYITLNLVGGFIPIFSNILTVVNSGLDLHDRKIDYSTSWMGRA